MKTLLFRGKSPDNEKIVKGYAAFDPDFSHAVIINKTSYNLMQMNAVYPESLGIRIGRKDKNGRDLYSSITGNKGSDILKLTYMGESRIGFIYYEEETSSFCIKTSAKRSDENSKEIIISISILFTDPELTSYEIIGNQFDNTSFVFL